MFTKTSLAFSLCATCAYAAFVPPARIDVPIVLGRSGRPMLSVGMGTQGAGQIQNFNFTLTTSLGYTSVVNKGCSDCSNTPSYDISLSPNARSLNGQPAVALGGGSFSGSVIKENCTLVAQQGMTWPYTNQTIVLVDSQTQGSPFQDGVSGILGLGTLRRSANAGNFSANFDDSLYGQYYIRNPEASNFTFGMALKRSPVIPGNSSTLSIAPGASSLADSDVGTVHWLQPDTSAFDQDKAQWRTVQNIGTGYLANNQPPEWTVSLDGWAAKIGSNNVGHAGSISVNVDPFYSGIYMPGSQARLIHDAIPGSEPVQKSTIQGQTSSWQVPCNTDIVFTVNIGLQQFTLDQSLLVVDQGDGTCVSLIEGFTDSGVTQYIFGQNWLSQLYVIFNIPKNGDAQLAFAPRSAAKSRDVGAIVGGTIGGVAGVIAIGLLVFYLIRRRQDNTFFKRAAELEEEHKVASTVEPYTFGQTPSRTGYADRSMSFGEPQSTPVSQNAPLLSHVHVAAPPSYEEASEVGDGYPREQRQATLMTINGGPSEPTTPNKTMLFASSSAA